MITDTCQRWDQRRESRRPAGEPIAPREYEVAPISPILAKAFVREHHYAVTCSPTAHCFGLFRRGHLVGVAVFGPLPSEAARAAVFPTLGQDEYVSLGRLVLLDEVPGNGESWFITRCFEILRERGIAGVESSSDPTPRSTLDGKIIHRGHVGCVYQATNGRYRGLTNDASLLLLPDGTCYSAKASAKVRRQIQGREYSGAQLVSFGAAPLREGEDPKAWLDFWRPRLTRKLRHRGNHRYVWSVDPKRAIEIYKYGPVLPYPKIGREARP